MTGKSPLPMYELSGTPQHEKRRATVVREVSHFSNIQGEKPNAQRVLNTLSIIGLCYFSVSGGPIGSEQIISSGGPLVGFIGLLLFPIISSIPMSYITAELSTTFPQDGGYTVWVLNAFGPFWAFQTGFWSWVAYVVDNALYPSIAVATFKGVFGSIGSPTVEYLVKATITILLSLPNIFGLRIVGKAMIVLTLFVIAPFVVLSIWGVIIGNDWSALGEIRREDITIDANDQADISGSVAIQWSLLLNTLFWNFNGFSNMSVFGGEVQNPGKTYPRALTISVVLVSLTYLIPLFGASVYNAPHWSTWEEGAFAQIAQSIGGPFLTGWIMFGTFGSNIGMFISYLLCNTFQIVGMSECGLAPTFLHRRSEKFGTPLNATLVCLAIILVLIMFEFEEILYIENALASSYQLLLLIAFLRLRYTHAELPRPVKVPGSAKVLMLVLLPTFGLYIWVVIDTFSSLSRAILIGSVMIVGFIYAKLKKFTREQFENLRMSQ